MKSVIVRFLIVCSTLIASQAKGYGADPAAVQWHHWRGPFQNGQANVNTRPPLRWDQTSNIRWSVELPGEGTATPIVWQDRLFVVSAEATERKSEVVIQPNENARTSPPNLYFRFIVSCLNRMDGKILWQRVAAEQVPHEGHHETHTYAASSPTTDGEHIYVSFASRGFFCYTMDGDLKWKIDLGDMRTRLGWGEAVTPVLTKNQLIINWDQEENSFITALDKKTGKELWKTSRKQEPTSWNTPLVIEDESLVVVNGTDRVRAYHLENGREVWSCGGQTVNAIPSPIRFEDSVICISGYRGAAGVAIPLRSSGDVTASPSLRWQIRQGTPYVPSPALSKDRLIFTAGNNGLLSCVDARSGKVLVDRKRIGGISNIYASPLVANGHIYLVSREGTTAVLREDDFESVSVNPLEGPMDASPVAIEKQLFLRSWRKIYCIEEN